MVISQQQAINFAIHIAKGMQWLHNHAEATVDHHQSIMENFYLNSKHVMIDSDLTAKLNLADYRFPHMDDKEKLYEPAWMAPEELVNKPDQVNKRSCDMWSFGTVLWELSTREIPFRDYQLPIQCGISV